MKIAVASGKGGTGKTTIAVNLAYIAATHGFSVSYIDCDVEEPNGALYLNPKITHRKPVLSSVPIIDEDLCDNCGRCVEVCEFNALSIVNGKALVFSELCHACGACWLSCPANAIRESFRTIGRVEIGTAKNISFTQGVLNIGEMLTPEVIAFAKIKAPSRPFTVIDSPPGTSCPAVESVRGTDFVVLVAEPTAFGLHDFMLAADMISHMKIPFGVVINKAQEGNRLIDDYCNQHGIFILASFPYDREAAKAGSFSNIASESVGGFKNNCEALMKTLQSLSR